MKHGWMLFLILSVSQAMGAGSHGGARGGGRAYASDKTKEAYAGPTYGLSDADVKGVLAQKTVDVPYYAQEGEKCGLYALKMVMAFHHKGNRNKRDPRVQKGEAGDTSVEPMWNYAQRNGYKWSDKGETTHGDLRRIASGYGYGAKAEEDPGGPDIDDLKKELAKGRPILCSVRAVKDGRPSTGESFEYGGHWIVVEGFGSHNGTEYVIVKHGWSGGSVIWRVDEFEKSWSRNWSSTVYVW